MAAIAALTGHDAELIAGLKLHDVQHDGAELAEGHVIPPHLQALIRAQALARCADGATADAPLFLTRDGRAAGPGSVSGWLARVSRELGLNFVAGYCLQARFDRAHLAAVFGIGHRATSDRPRRLAL